MLFGYLRVLSKRLFEGIHIPLTSVITVGLQQRYFLYFGYYQIEHFNNGTLFYPTTVVCRFLPQFLHACGRSVEWATLQR